MQPLGTRIKRIRTQKGLTQQALAVRVGLTQPYIVMLETGKRTNPSLQLLQRLAKALGVPLAELLQSREATNKKQYGIGRQVRERRRI